MPKLKEKPYALWRGKPSRWDFWKDGVSSSLIILWLTCREQFRLKVVEGWVNRTPNKAILFGTLVHYCLQRLYEVKRDAQDKRQLVSVIQAFEKQWKAESQLPTKKGLLVLDECCGLAEAVLPTYFKRWAGDLPGGKYPGQDPVYKRCPKRWLALEEQFDVWVKTRMGDVRVRGTRDGLYTDREGRTRVFDTKCFSIVDDDDILDTLEVNLQQMLYLWAAWKQFGEFPAGCMINVVRRPGHRQGKDETLASLLRRVRKDVEDPKRWSWFFRRYAMDILPQEIRDWEKNFLVPVLEDMAAWWEGMSPHYMNPNALITKYGRCDMFEPIVFNRFDNCYRKPAGTILDYQAQVA